ncbi:MAG: hypothetical protein AB1454_00345 [Candidatus Auribacterota bacterium]
MKKTFILLILFLAAACENSLVPAKEIEITIEKKIDRKIRVTILPFFSETNNVPASRELYSVAEFDLKHAGYFELWPQEPLPDSALDKGKNYKSADYDFWLDYGTEMIIKGLYTMSGTELAIELFCYDMATRSEFTSVVVNGPISETRALMHKATAKIIEKVSGGRPSITTTQIAFVQQNGKAKNIFMMDYDGHNVRQVTSNTSLNLDPNWLPNGEGIIYSSYFENYPFIYLQNFRTRSMQIISKRPGLNSVPDVSPDGTKIALTLSFNGNPEIYVIDFSGNVIQRVTFSPAVDTSPTWAPDSNTLAFVSDRSGTPQIYVVDYRGGTPKRITFQGNYNASPDWSPIKGSNIIVYSSLYGRNSELCIIDASSGFFRRLTTSMESEDHPTWAPDGIHVSYTLTQNYRSDIYFMDVREEKPVRVTTDSNNSSLPDWGPSLQ